MRLRCYETIYMIKEVYTIDAGIVFTTFDDKLLLAPMPKGDKQEMALQQLTVAGHLEVFELKEF